MQSGLRQFVSQYLAIIFATLMSVGFVAFLSIPYSLGGHPGDLRAPQSLVQTGVQAPMQTTVPPPTLSPEA